jgi:RNA polymerase sigma-70 factor (ECF subfamily)
MYSLCRKKKICFSAVEIESLKEIESEYTLPPDIREQKYAALRKSVKELPEELKNLVELKIWKRMTLQAIADKLNMKKSTVAAKLKSAYQKIEKSMIDKGYDDGLI